MLVQTLLQSSAPAADVHTRNPWFTVLWQRHRNSKPRSHLQDNNHFHTSGFNDSLGLPPLPGANDFSCRPASHFPLCLVVFLGVWNVFSPSGGPSDLFLFSAAPRWFGDVFWGFLVWAQSVSKIAAAAACQELLRAFWFLRQSLKMDEAIRKLC